MKFLSFSGAKHLCFVCCCIFLVGSCNKEPLDIRDVPFEELESSYYKLASNSVEIPHDVATSQLIFKDNTSISFSNSENFDAVQLRDIIVSSMDTPSQEFICRKVLEESNTGSGLNFMTERATIIEAYESFYFNTRKSGLIQVRDESIDVGGLLSKLGDKFGDKVLSIADGILPGEVSSDFD